jgi:hypothetical protein
VRREIEKCGGPESLINPKGVHLILFFFVPIKIPFVRACPSVRCGLPREKVLGSR